jgi:hypothetical protein
LATATDVDTKTLHRKVMAGYQGWFNTPADGCGMGWRHYARRGAREVTPETCKFDLWPDTRELDDGELCETGFRHADGRAGRLPSSCNRKSVLRHFRWMREYGLDGVFVQRFHSYCAQRERFAHMLKVLDYCREGARVHGRAYAMMYDMSGMRGEDCAPVIDDWKRLLDETALVDDDTYLRHGGRPVVTVWGLGFTDRPHYSWADCMPLVEYLKGWGATVMLGIPTGWREQPQQHLQGPDPSSRPLVRCFDCVADPAMHDALQTVDILSPWSVARAETLAGAERLARDFWVSDMQWCRQHGLEYMPVVYPGFSWHNARPNAPLDRVRRRKGAMLWKLYYEAVRAGATMIYQAMFDELDEATAIFKCTADPPGGDGQFIDLEGVPSDHYLKLVGQAGRMLRGEIPLQERCPLID